MNTKKKRLLGENEFEKKCLNGKKKSKMEERGRVQASYPKRRATRIKYNGGKKVKPLGKGAIMKSTR